MLDKMRAIDALEIAILYLRGAFLVLISVAFLLSLLSYIKNKSTLAADTKLTWFAGKFIQLATFGSLGIVLAYLMSIGINRSDASNALVGTLGSTIIAIISGTITYFESAPGNSSRPRTEIITFLLTFVVTYQMFSEQLTHVWPK